jgi:hypothetical protein
VAIATHPSMRPTLYYSLFTKLFPGRSDLLTLFQAMLCVITTSHDME